MLIESAFSQRTYPGAGDLDDCWVVSSIQAVHAHWPTLRLPTVTEFRRAAGDPDDGHNDGGNQSEIIQGIDGTWVEPIHTRLSGASWETFATYMTTHKIATVAVVSGSLPISYQYGFKGLHQVTIEWFNNGWWITNPLQAEGSEPRQIGAASLRKAMYDYGNGTIYAVVIHDPKVVETMDYQTTIDSSPVPFGGKFTIPANTKVTGIQLGPAGVAATKVWIARPTASVADYDAMVYTNKTRGNPFIRATSGYFAGWLITAGAVIETPNPAPPKDDGLTPFDQADIDKAVADATAPYKVALANERADDEAIATTLEAAAEALRK